jgi:uncharacterized repeat protein (TIGR02543 family)
MRNKWLMVLVTLLAAFGLVFTGCGGGSGGGTYTVTFDKNTDEVVTGMPTTQQVAEGGKVTKPSNPVLYGYYVAAWSTDRAGVSPWDFATDTVMADMTLFAQWEPLDEVDLGEFTVWGDGGKGASHSGWASNGYDSIETDLDIEVLLSAEYLVLELTGKPVGGVQIAWQGIGPGVEKSDWFQLDVLQNNGNPNPERGTSWDAENNLLIIQLSLALNGTRSGTYDPTSYGKFMSCTSGAKILIGYWSGSPSGLPSLGIQSAWLLVRPINESDKVTVTFDTNGGEPEIDPIEVTKGFTMNTQYPADPEKEDYAFGGWFIDVEDPDTQYFSDTQVNTNITLVAKWLDLIIVTFDSDGGSAVADVKVGEGQSMGSKFPAAPTKAGFVFDGWYLSTDAAYENEIKNNTPIDEAVTLKAKWLTEITVTFNLDSGTLASLPGSVKIGQGRSLGSQFPGNPTKTGWKFDGWYVGDVKYSASTPITATVELKAVYIKLHTVTFKAEVADATALKTVTIEDGETLAAADYPEDNPSKDGHSFGGWYASTDTSFKTRYDDADPAIVITADIILVAKFTALQNAVTILFKISADDADADAYARIQVESGDSIGTNFPRKPSKGYSIFTGWKNGTTDFTATTPVTANITVVAQWNDPLVITEFTVTDAFWHWSGVITDNLIPFDGDGAGLIEFDSAINFTPYDAIIIEFLVDNTRSQTDTPMDLMIKTKVGSDYPTATNVTLQNGTCFVAVAGTAFQAIATAGNIGFQANTWGNNDGLYDVTPISMTLIPKTPDGTYGAQDDGSYVLDPRTFMSMYGASLFLYTIQFSDNGGMKIKYPDDFVFSDYATLVIEYETSGFSSGTPKITMAKPNFANQWGTGSDVYYRDLADGSGILELDLSTSDTSDLLDDATDQNGIAFKINASGNGAQGFDLRFISITFYPPVEE